MFISAPRDSWRYSCVVYIYLLYKSPDFLIISVDSITDMKLLKAKQYHLIKWVGH